jgi:hypothetical protein
MKLAVRKVVKKTFNIEEASIKKMEKLVLPRRQSAFVELAIKEKLQKAEEEILLNKLQNKIKNIKRIKPIITAVDCVRQIRKTN